MATLSKLRGGALGLACALWAPQASALEVAAEIDLAYSAPSGCPSRSEFLRDLGRRVDRVAPAWRTDPRRFIVRIERLPGAFLGRLDVKHENRAPESRETRAETCKAVSSALAVFMAIALDPATEDRHDRDEAPRPLAAARSPPPPAPPRRRPPLAATSASRTASPPRSVFWELRSELGLAYVHAPNAAWGARVGAEIARMTVGSRVAPVLGLSWGFADFDESPSGEGTASFRFQTTRVVGCPRIDFAPFAVEPCVGLEFGTLQARSGDIPQVGRASTAWYALTGLLRASWLVLPWLAIQGDLGLSAPLRRTTFALTEPIRVVYRPPGVLFSAGAGLGVSARFP